MSLVIGVFFYSTPLNRRDGCRNSIDERATDPRNAVASRDGWWFLRVAADEKKFQHTRLVSEFAIASADVIAKVHTAHAGAARQASQHALQETALTIEIWIPS